MAEARILAELGIRPAVMRDLPAILDIERASFGDPWRERTFRSLLVRPGAEVVVAEGDGRLRGYAAVWWVEDQAELGNVAVDVAFRGRGVASALLEDVFGRLRGRDVHECFLEVRESNAPARRMYERFGFVVVGRRRRYYRDPVEDALMMRAEWPARR